MIEIQLWQKKTGASRVSAVIEKFRARAEFMNAYQPWLKENNIDYDFNALDVMIKLSEEDALAFKLRFQI
jgi:hypothetical protein